MEQPTKLQNGAQILQMKPRDSESWYVLANTERQPQPWVVWTCWSDGHCAWGHYFGRLTEAAAHFETAKR